MGTIDSPPGISCSSVHFSDKSISCGYSHKLPPTKWIKTTQMCFPTILHARSLTPRSEQASPHPAGGRRQSIPYLFYNLGIHVGHP